ncbi:hypothetical protein CRUP_001378 [Coryphaenoides rupestris]|nr:hypothetical protein CRUP_001378 [Coryphaenoides rupestris]
MAIKGESSSQTTQTQHAQPPCLAELERIQVQEVAKKKPVLDKSLVASCKDSIGWMFSRLDSDGDLYLDHGELAAINLDKYEVCIRPFFNSCDSFKDGKVSTAEWCFCFWRESCVVLVVLVVLVGLVGGGMGQVWKR